MNDLARVTWQLWHRFFGGHRVKNTEECLDLVKEMYVQRQGCRCGRLLATVRIPQSKLIAVSDAPAFVRATGWVLS
ncbi:hypothetical protein LCGC14_3104220 [marine sediment metagenome]|uniref:Uncharacterized protein n=1 Tax=marine sediment metagenome TaxID=412755 RepID=A0A0F8YEE1_9ZZZZ